MSKQYFYELIQISYIQKKGFPFLCGKSKELILLTCIGGFNVLEMVMHQPVGEFVLMASTSSSLESVSGSNMYG